MALPCVWQTGTQLLTARKALAPLIAAVLIVLVAMAIVYSYRRAAADRVARAVVTAHGVVGSEKQAFFQDPAVLDELRKNGIALDIEARGSRDQALSATKDGADFYFPAGEPAGRALAKRLGVADPATPFYTPMVIASWDPILHTLQSEGIADKTGAASWSVVHMDKLLALMQSGKRWSDLPRNTGYSVNKSILISSTDPRKSNSAGMYLALASYVMNGNQVVSGAAQAQKIERDLNGLFLRQGFQESSSAGPFEDYTSIGMGKTPLVMIYEQQYVEYLLATPKAQRPAGMALLYPKPTLFTKHTIVPITAAGRKIASLLQTDEILRAAEIRHGFRINDASAVTAAWKAGGIDLPAQILDVVDPPSFESLETMLHGVEAAYKAQ